MTVKTLEAKISELKSDIEGIEQGLKEPNLNQQSKDLLEATLKDIRQELKGLELKLAKKVKKQEAKASQPKKQPTAKAVFQFAGRNIDEVSIDEMKAAFIVRRQQYQATKTKTQSVISNAAIDLAKSAEPIVKAVIDNADTTKQATTDIKKIGDIIENAINELRQVMAQYVNDSSLSESARQDLESFESIANDLKNKYGDKPLSDAA